MRSGEGISHPKFGIGNIEHVEQLPGSVRLHIRFGEELKVIDTEVASSDKDKKNIKNSPVQGTLSRKITLQADICDPYLASCLIRLKSAYIIQKSSQTGCYKDSDRIHLLP